jgi:hypothetical protein
VVYYCIKLATRNGIPPSANLWWNGSLVPDDHLDCYRRHILGNRDISDISLTILYLNHIFAPEVFTLTEITKRDSRTQTATAGIDISGVVENPALKCVKKFYTELDKRHRIFNALLFDRYAAGIPVSKHDELLKVWSGVSEDVMVNKLKNFISPSLLKSILDGNAGYIGIYNTLDDMVFPDFVMKNETKMSESHIFKVFNFFFIGSEDVEIFSLLNDSILIPFGIEPE